MTSPISVLRLLLTAGSLRGLASEQAQYRWEDGEFNNTVEVSLSAWSTTSCAISCTAMKPWFCGGFTYRDSGACDLYRDREEASICVNPLEAAPPLVVESVSEPRSYRRLQANRSTCPGGSKCSSMYAYAAKLLLYLTGNRKCPYRIAGMIFLYSYVIGETYFTTTVLGFELMHRKSGVKTGITS